MMTTSIEELIREAQHQQADRAVHPTRVLAALSARRARVARRRRMTFAFASTAVAATMAVPIFVFAERSGPAVTTGWVGGDPSPRPSAALVAAVPMRFVPTWLPAGYTERQRSATPNTVTRAWVTKPLRAPDYNPDEAGLKLTVMPASAQPTWPSLQEVDVNGAVGHYLHGVDGKSSFVTWLVDGQTALELASRDRVATKEVLLRVARSMRPDPSVLEPPFDLRSVPEGLTLQRGLGVSGNSPANWSSQVSVGRFNPDGSVNNAAPFASISLGTVRGPTTGGTAVRAGGRPAWFVKQRAIVPVTGYYLIVDVGAGRWLTVFAVNLSQERMLDLAQRVALRPAPDVSWIGR
jgi:hypothetical protein